VAYLPDLALTLINLGNLYDDTHRFAEADDLERARRRTRQPTNPIWRGRSTTWAISTGIQTASLGPRPPTMRPPTSVVGLRRRTRRARSGGGACRVPSDGVGRREQGACEARC
jgi:hypothetical protein